jgi:hypothetical protein
MTNDRNQAGSEGGLAEQASAKAQDVASVAQEKASELREQGSARLRDQFDQRSTEAGMQVRLLAEALRRSGNDLRNEGESNAGLLAGRAADQIERVGNYLEKTSGGDVMREVETFARRRPWMLATIGMLAGMAAARFVKASSDQRYDSQRKTSGQRPSSAREGQGRRVGYRGSEFARSGDSADELASASANVPGFRRGDPLDLDPFAGAR